MDDKKTNISFSDRLKICRQKLDLLQTDLADKIGVSIGTIQNYEGGQLPKSEHLLKLSKLFECSTDWLLKGDDHKKEEMRAVKSHQYKEADSEKSVTGPVIEYEQGNQKISDLLSKTAEILESETIYRYALTSNINAFHHSILLNAKLEKMELRLYTLESTCEDMKNRLEEAEKESDVKRNAATKG